jgi:hypothetical protein
MTLTNGQKKDLKELGKRLRELERLTTANSIDLDVFITGYDENGVSIYSTEQVSQRSNAAERKKVFEKHGRKEKQIQKH